MDEVSEVIYRDQEGTVDKVVQALSEEKVLVLPCDTIYGLCAKVGDVTRERIYALKERDQRKPLLLLATIAQAEALCVVPEAVKKVWPCALTAIMRNKADGGTTAIRVPKDPFLQKVLEKLGSPIYSTSVNLSGYASMTNINDIIFAFKDKVPMFVVADEGQGTTPSTLIDTTKTPFALIRRGAFDPTDLLK